MPSPDGDRPLHLLHVFSTFGVGGPQVRFAALAKLWGPHFRHSLMAMDGNYACWERLDPAVPAERLSVPVAKGRGLSLTNLRRFGRLLRETRPDVLITSNFGTIEWALANRLGPRVRQIHMEDGFGPEEASGRQLARRVRLRRLALGGADVVVPSRGLERIATDSWRIPPERVHHIPNGIDLARFAGPGRSPSEPLAIGFVGALRAEKNVERLLRAFAFVPEPLPAQLVLIGDGPERARLQALAVELGIGALVRFPGAVADPERVLTQLDLFALSSDTEQMPLSLLEAMAAGLPAVATDVGDIALMVAAENRPFIVPPDDAALAGAMTTLLGDPDLRRRIGIANRARAEAEFGEERMAERYAALIAG